MQDSPLCGATDRLLNVHPLKPYALNLQGQSRVVAKLDVGDAFGGGRVLLPEEDAPERAGVLAQSDVKLYAIPTALLQRRGDPELWRQVKDEARNPLLFLGSLLPYYHTPNDASVLWL